MALTANVVNDELIEAAWGNEIRDRTRQVFATVAELKAAWPAAPNGSTAIALDTGRTFTRLGGVWVCREPLTGRTAQAINGVGHEPVVPFGVTFQVAPIVMAIIEAGGFPDFVLNLMAGSVTTLQFQFRIATRTGAPVNQGYNLQWVAFGTWIA